MHGKSMQGEFSSEADSEVSLYKQSDVSKADSPSALTSDTAEAPWDTDLTTGKYDWLAIPDFHRSVRIG